MSISRNMTIGSAVTVVAALVGVWATLDPWPAIGWTTPSQHARDVAEIEAKMASDAQKILDAIEELGEKQVEGRDEWKCDEFQEELEALLKAQRDGDDSVETAEKIRKIRERMGRDDLDCNRFEDFG